MQKSTSILYFDAEGRENLPQVLRVIRRALTRRPDLRSLPVVIFTANGEGPALAYAQLHEFDIRIIGVTFPPDFSVARGTETYSPGITPKLAKFFDGVGIRVIRGRLPLDPVDGLDAHNSTMQTIKETLAIFGGGFPLSVQAVLAACDAGEVPIGDRVLAVTGDTAAIITASTTRRFLSKHGGLVVNEILCKPRNLTISRAKAPQTPDASLKQFDEKALPKVIDVKALSGKPSRKP